jgi:hypothetical protein
MGLAGLEYFRPVKIPPIGIATRERAMGRFIPVLASGNERFTSVAQFDVLQF